MSFVGNLSLSRRIRYRKFNNCSNFKNLNWLLTFEYSHFSGHNSATLHYGHSGEPNAKTIENGDMWYVSTCHMIYNRLTEVAIILCMFGDSVQESVM